VCLNECNEPSSPALSLHLLNALDSDSFLPVYKYSYCMALAAPIDKGIIRHFPDLVLSFVVDSMIRLLSLMFFTGLNCRYSERLNPVFARNCHIWWKSLEYLYKVSSSSPV